VPQESIRYIRGKNLKHLNNFLFFLLKMASSPYINRFLQPDTLIPGVDSPQSWNRYSYVKNNPVLYNDPSGHDSILSQFLAGFTAEVVSSILWFSPKVQQDLAPNEHESVAMLAGRVVGDIASTVVSVAGIGTGGAAIAGGSLCVGLSAGGCLPAGAPTAVAGGALVLEGAGMSVRGAIGLGSNLALLAKKTGESLSSKNNKDLKQVDSVAKKLKMSKDERYDFGDYVESEKYNGEGGSANIKRDFTFKELLEKGRRFLEEIRKPK
jgi:hypothetical protein